MSKRTTLIPSISNLMNLSDDETHTLCAGIVATVKACHAYKATRGKATVERKHATAVAAIARYDRASVEALHGMTCDAFKPYRASVVQRMKNASEVFACADPAATVAMIDRTVAAIALWRKESLSECLFDTVQRAALAAGAGK